MSDGDGAVTDTIAGHGGAAEVILVRLEGKIDRLADRLERYERDFGAVRQRIEALAGDLQPLVILDLPGRIRVADAERSRTDARLTALEAIELQRKGAAKLAAALWAVAGALGTGGCVALVKLLGGS